MLLAFFVAGSRALLENQTTSARDRRCEGFLVSFTIIQFLLSYLFNIVLAVFFLVCTSFFHMVSVIFF